MIPGSPIGRERDTAMRSAATQSAWIIVLALGAILAGLAVLGSATIGYVAYYASGSIAVLAILLSTRIHRIARPGHWYLLAGGLAVYLLGDGAWDYLANTSADVSSIISPATPFYVIGMVILIVAWFRLGERFNAGYAREDTIDGAIVALSFAVVSWAFLVAPRLTSRSMSTGDEALALIYPLLDLFVLMVLMRIALRHGLRRRRFIVLFILGTMAILTSDSLYGWGELTGTYGTYESLADIGWQLWFTLWAAAALHPSVRAAYGGKQADDEAIDPSSRKRIAFMTVAALITPVSLLINPTAASNAFETIVITSGTVMIFGLVIYRMMLMISSVETSLHKQATLRDELEQVAYRDALTGLANRARLNRRLEHMIEAASAPDTVVLFLDLDNFKVVNDRFGHASGDNLLIELADRLVQCVRTSDVVYRLGGDEFLILLELNGRSARAASIATAERILLALEDPVILNGKPVAVSASIGIAWPGTGDSVDSILGAADRAMYQAKHAGKNRFQIAPASQGVTTKLSQIDPEPRRDDARPRSA